MIKKKNPAIIMGKIAMNKTMMSLSGASTGSLRTIRQEVPMASMKKTKRAMMPSGFEG
jgi:hypothetical protein